VLVWVLLALLLFPAGFAGYAVGHYTSLGKPPKTVVSTTTIGSTSSQTTSAATSTSSGTTTSSGGGGGNAAAGKAVFTSNGCSGCHTFKPANSNGTIGPDLDSAPAQDAKADNNMALAAFVKESIVDPNKYIAKGFSSGIMPGDFGSKLSSSQIDDLVAFILSGTKS
jgi:cytochrome c551/c552